MCEMENFTDIAFFGTKVDLTLKKKKIKKEGRKFQFQLHTLGCPERKLFLSVFPSYKV